MPITPVNKVKNAITPTTHNKSGYALWGDNEVTWGDAVLTWGAPYATVVNRAKNTITPVNKVKN